MAVFQGIFADIGDEQSIEQSLSTFSGHLTNIISILRDMPDNSLLLLDELGAGTDPAEGSALARSLLSFLLERDVRVMATTHYSELKAFAAGTGGVQNANVEFDVESLSPTYRLSIGLPGRSNALAIAQRLGLPTEILEGSRQFITDEEQRVETMLAEIQADRERAAALLSHASQAEREAISLRERLETEVQGVLRDREIILRTARAEAEASVADLRRELDRAESELRLQGNVPQHSIEQLRNRIEVVTAQQSPILAPPVVSKQAQEPVLSLLQDQPFAVGDPVSLLRTGQDGVIVSIAKSGEQFEVQVGPFKTRAKRSELRRRVADPTVLNDSYTARQPAYRQTSPAPSIELDMRGWRVDEVLHELERYISDAYMANLPFVRLIHGKGTGALRQVVREELATNPLVSTFRQADQREGGEGVTVAQLAV